MPHHFVNRPRLLALVRRPSERADRDWESVSAIVYLVGGAMFIWGSVLFLPGLSAKANEGAWIFIVGSVLYLFVTGHDAIEVVRYRRQLTTPPTLWDRLETWSAGTYLLGTVLFLVGSVLFLAAVDRIDLGSLCFIIGSALFVAGATVDVLRIGRAPDRRLLQLMNLTAITFVTGSVLFLVASVPYLFSLGTATDERLVAAMSAAQYIWGSILFLLGGAFNFRRSALVAGRPLLLDIDLVPPTGDTGRESAG